MNFWFLFFWRIEPNIPIPMWFFFFKATFSRCNEYSTFLNLFVDSIEYQKWCFFIDESLSNAYAAYGYVGYLCQIFMYVKLH